MLLLSYVVCPTFILFHTFVLPYVFLYHVCAVPRYTTVPLTALSDQVWHRYSCFSFFNPIPAEVLENQDTLGGGQFDPPPSKSYVWCPKMTNDTSLESSCTLLLESTKKIANLQILNFFAKSSYIVKMFAKKKLFCKFCKILNNLMFN